MSVSSLTFGGLDPNQDAWDAQINDDFEIVRQWLQDGPLPIKDYANPGSLPTASSWDRSIAFANDSGTWKLYFSNGSGWVEASPAASKLDLAGGTLTGQLNLIYASRPTIRLRDTAAESVEASVINFEESTASSGRGIQFVHDTLNNRLTLEGYLNGVINTNYIMQRDTAGLIVCEGTRNDRPDDALGVIHVETGQLSEPGMYFKHQSPVRALGATLRVNHNGFHDTELRLTDYDMTLVHEEGGTGPWPYISAGTADSYVYGATDAITSKIYRKILNNPAAAYEVVDGSTHSHALHVVGTTVFFYGVATGDIRSISTTGGSQTAHVTDVGTTTVPSLKYNATTAEVTYIDLDNQKVRKAPIAGSSSDIITLSGDDQPLRVCIDEAGERLFLAYRNSSTGIQKIERCAIDGTGRTVIAQSSAISTDGDITGMEYDADGDQLIVAWGGTDDSAIVRMDATGTQAQVEASIIRLAEAAPAYAFDAMTLHASFDVIANLNNQSVDLNYLCYGPLEPQVRGIEIVDRTTAPSPSTTRRIVMGTLIGKGGLGSDVTRVGIGNGTWTPAAELHIRDEGPRLILEQTDTSLTSEITMRDDASVDRFRIYWDNANERIWMRIANSSGVQQNAMVINDDGRIGLGQAPGDLDTILLNRSGQPSQIRFENAGGVGTENSHKGKLLFSTDEDNAMGFRGNSVNSLALVRRNSGTETVIGSLNGNGANGWVDMLTGYYVNGTKVIGTQGSAVADATGTGDVVAQLNALLARCRAHGIIAT